VTGAGAALVFPEDDNGDDLLGERRAQALRPAQERVQKALRVGRGEKTVEWVMAWDALGQFQEGAQPGLPGVVEKLPVLEALRPAEQCADGDEQDVPETCAV
jgi:hypothetical protein